METNLKITGEIYADAIRTGAAGLRAHAEEVNDLNVFPIPDGDTGSNMLLTVMGGVDAIPSECGSLSSVARAIADGMLLAARGNSGVILSQLFDGIAAGFADMDEADAEGLGHAMQVGVEHAYRSVLEPTEGTILTVARCAAAYANDGASASVQDYLERYVAEAKRTLERTPDLLPVLKKAGVVDSGGAGLVYILEGMYRLFTGDADAIGDADLIPHTGTQTLDLSRFDENSVLEFGYCTELLLRLQTAKTDPAAFEVSTVTDYLREIGESVVAFKTGSIVKIHVHTMTPDKVLGFCQQFGEFLTVKIENMSLQHNNAASDGEEQTARRPESMPDTERRKYGVVAVCTGSGVKQMFTDRGADVIVDGGQSMNPSAEDFIRAFREVNAEVIVVLPNNGNVILAAKQAAELFGEADVRVLESKTVGDGYAALSMMNPDAEDADELMEELSDAMQGVVTAEVSHCIRDADLQGMHLHTGDYIGVIGKEFLASDTDRPTAVCKTADALGFGNYDICILIKGKDADMAEAEALVERLCAEYPGHEVYLIDGMQDVYDYILILQ